LRRGPSPRRASLLFVCVRAGGPRSAAAARGRGGRVAGGRTALARRRRRVLGFRGAGPPRLRVSRARDWVLSGRSGSVTVGGDSETRLWAKRAGRPPCELTHSQCLSAACAALVRAHAKLPQLRLQEKPRTSLRSGPDLFLLPGPVQVSLSLKWYLFVALAPSGRGGSPRPGTRMALTTLERRTRAGRTGNKHGPLCSVAIINQLWRTPYTQT
jgi:hypothetical protein